MQEALPRTALPVVSDINEGRPVSLRVVNDLVQLRAKEELIEYGPVNYEVSLERGDGSGGVQWTRGVCWLWDWDAGGMKIVWSEWLTSVG